MTTLSSASPARGTLANTNDDNANPQARALSTVFNNLPFWALSYCLLSAGFVVALNLDGNAILVWLICGCLICAAQCRVSASYAKQERIGSAAPWWQIHYSLSLLGGLHGAYLCLAFFPADNPSAQILLVVLVMATFIGSVCLNAVSPSGFAAFSFPTGIALASQLMLTGTTINLISGLTVLLALAAAQRGSMVLNEIIRSHLMLIRATQQGASHTASLVNYAELNRRVQTLASHPGLTGDGVALIMIEIDQIADIRSQRGPAEADRLLNLVSMSLRSSLRAADTLARSQHEGFVVLLSPCTATVAKIVGDKMVDTVRRMDLRRPDNAGLISARAGVAHSSTGKFDPQEMIQQAVEQSERARTEGLNARSFVSL